eukprot:TRINITY_DN97014_c0_g1_i1.p1 TRINITY_DN97014_c0_g1~~TRINITY_DN97014_c0_g1_i1.p1  ORF type:complete len:372 (+),score=65.64 TRINITY_DN97014_c0_g1_i1:67-1182(+)
MAVDNSVAIGLSVTGWYLTSFSTLLLNKYIMGTLHVQPNTLALVQMVSTAIYGALKTLSFSDARRIATEVKDLLLGAATASTKVADLELAGQGTDAGDFDLDAANGKTRRWRKTLFQIGAVGVMRFATVVLGLVSLKHVAASFTETIKASAPFFTVIIAYLMLGEKTSLLVLASLIPVAGGLVLASSAELSFNLVGFSAAVATNVIECVQNVFSKGLLASEYTAGQLQFYTSLTALVIQAPLLIYNGLSSTSAASAAGAGLQLQTEGNSTVAALEHSIGGDGMLSGLPNGRLVAILWIDGVLYHLQSVVAYVVMSYLSPVTVSVVNTLKRAMLIWISVQVFGNQVTPLSMFGTVICLLGALGYNYAKQVKL